MKEVTVYSRSGCHLCEIAIDRINSVINDYKFTLNVILIDNNNDTVKVDFDATSVHVGDAAQTQFAGIIRYEFAKNA